MLLDIARYARKKFSSKFYISTPCRPSGPYPTIFRLFGPLIPLPTDPLLPDFRRGWGGGGIAPSHRAYPYRAGGPEAKGSECRVNRELL